MLVKAEGPLSAKIVLVGEAPGAEEERMGRPFIGGSGQLLDQCLAKAGIQRSMCYVTNIMEVRPPYNNFEAFYEDGKKKTTPSSLLLAGIERLHKELRTISPNVIVPLGAEPLRAITGLRGIDKWRGSILHSNFGKVVPTFHPAAVLRTFSIRPLLQLDLQRVAKQSTFPDVRLPTHTFHIDPSFEMCMDWLRLIKKGQTISFDIETVGDIIRCLGIGISGHEAMCIPFTSTPGRFRPGELSFIPLVEGEAPSPSSHWKEDEEYVILQELERILGDHQIKKVAQNYPFDSSALEKQFGLVIKGLRLDTMLGFHCCYCELPKDLSTLVSIYTEIPYYADYNVSSDIEVWRYNCYDCVGTWAIVAGIEKDLHDKGLTEFYHNHLQPAMLALTRAENRGIRVNQKVMHEELIRYHKLMGYKKDHVDENGSPVVGSITKTIREFVLRRARNDEEREKALAFNPNSPPQLCGLFYDTLGLPIKYNHKTKQRTADKNARDQLAKQYPEHQEIFQTIDEWSVAETLVSGFLSRTPRANGRMYTHYNLAGTLTGRIASSDPIFEVGTNLTNIPRGSFRRIFLADGKDESGEDEWLIKSDLKSAEWMVVCWSAPIQRLIDQYAKNPDWDVHRWAASRVYSKPEEEITKDLRALAKNGVYGGNYGMQASRASITWKTPFDKADFILKRWHAEVPEVRSLYWGKIQSAITSTRCVENLLGRKRMFFDRINYPPSPLDQIFRDAYSHYAQSTVADIINRAFALMDHFFPEAECKLLLQVHDEIVGTCKKRFVPLYVNLFRKFMEYPIIVPGVSTPLLIQAEVTVGPNWYDQKPLKEYGNEFEGCTGVSNSLVCTQLSKC